MQFYATDSAYWKSFLVDKMYRLQKDEERKEADGLLEAAIVFLKTQNNCLLIINETFKSKF